MTNEDAIKHIKFALIDGHYELPRATALEALLLAIDALANQPQWIPVTERLPNIATKCIVQLSNGYITIGKYFSIEKWTFIETGIAFAYPKETVLAWMPMPEPYTKEEQS